MFAVFAIDPLVLSDEARLFYILDHCGVRTGRFIAKCPRNWQSMVLDARDWSPVQRLRIVEKLRLATALPISEISRDFARESWLAETEKESLHFKAIVASQNPRSHPKVVLDKDLDPEVEPWLVPRECRVSQQAQRIVESISPLLRASREVILVDPHFGPELARYRTVLEYLLQHAVAASEKAREGDEVVAI